MKMVDLNECDFHLDSCDINAECENTIGSYECHCRSGYHGNGRICNGNKDNIVLSVKLKAIVHYYGACLCFSSLDIDECIIGLDNCTENSNCRNLNGTFDCGMEPVIKILEPGIIILLYKYPCVWRQCKLSLNYLQTDLTTTSPIRLGTIFV